MEIQITGCLRHCYAPFLHQPHCLKLELAAELPSSHSYSPVPSNTFSRCPRNRQQSSRNPSGRDHLADSRQHREERYERWTYHRTKTQARRKSNGGKVQSARDTDRIAGRCVFLPVRYADDFVVLVSGTQEDAIAEKSALAEYLHRTMGLELSPEKTKVTAMTEGFELLGFRFGMHWDKRYGYGPRVEIRQPTSKSQATDET
ncbi:hypothetical protein [Mesorhizobium sp. M1322]|uniref:hypothetical protein n=1 Tax=Mesorhizobium sp. M1322 TaxID=2957081 RepID=UPI00333843CC